MTAPVQRIPLLARVRLLADGAALPILCLPLGMGAIVLTGMKNQYADLMAQFVAPLLVLTVAALVMLLVLRLWHSAVLAGLTTLVLAIAIWPQIAPAGPKPDRNAPVVKVYSANIHVLNGDVQAIRKSIEAANADVVVLIEVSNDVAAGMDAVLAGYPHRAPGDVAVGSTTVIASRWPLVTRVSPADGLDGVLVEAETPLGPVELAGVHLARPWPFLESWAQISQTMAIQSRLEPITTPRILVGDFNSVSSGRIGRQVREDIGLHAAPGFPGTWPSSLPAVLGMTIDQVYVSDDLAFVSRKLGQDNGSDHRPVVTEITRAAR